MQITFLGQGDSLGTPRVYCDCTVCREARTSVVNRRLRSSLWLQEDNAPPLLLDCGPDWREQMESIGVRNAVMGLLTHAHFDHIGGLVDWADACRWTHCQADVFAPAEVLEEALQRFPWVGSRLRMHANDGGMAYGEWNVTPWKVNHGKNGYAYAYRFDHPKAGKSWAYCSDSINLSAAEKKPLQGLDLLVLGTSYAEEHFPMETRSVYDMKEGLALAEEVGARSVLFTHLSHDIDANRDYGLPPHVRLATTGMNVRI
jgi:phosphoribosyl 1,2-cyclic phosphate phosphodiesterase